MFCQCTLAESVAAVGIGLHSGRKIRLVLHPAPEDSGIVFRRVDLNPPVDIPAAPMNVNDTRMATTVNVGRAAVATMTAASVCWASMEHTRTWIALAPRAQGERWISVRAV